MEHSIPCRLVHPDVAAVLRAFDLPWSADQSVQLDRLVDWLKSEARSAGGIGPGEPEILENRHIADSLLYLPPDLEADEVLDIGSGIGLPGLVLAIAHPSVGFTLVDRSGRRADLMKRAVRITGVDNVIVEQRDVRRDAPPAADLVTMRAVFPPDLAAEFVAGLSARAAVIGLSRTGEPPGLADRIAATHLDFDVEVRKSEILDPPSWLLIMART